MYTPAENRLGLQPIAQANVPNAAVQSGQSPFFNKDLALGSIIRADDPIYGAGEFIYMQLASAQVVGSVVTYSGYGTVSNDGTANKVQYQASLAPATANLAQPLAVAMSVFPSGSPATAFGWFQISGAAVVATNGTLAAGPGPVYLAGSGQVTSAQANGKQIMNAQNVTATGTPAAGFAIVAINRPFAEGQVV